MARFISANESNLFKSSWRKFNSLDLFTRFAIATLILIVIATPFIVHNHQLFHARGETQEDNLQTIAQLEKSQENLRSIFKVSSTAPITPPLTTKVTSNSAQNFNLVDTLQGVILRILQVFIR
jgi:hypothetical protein